MNRLRSINNDLKHLKVILSNIVASMPNLNLQPNNPEFGETIQTMVDVISQYQDLNQLTIDIDTLINLVKEYVPACIKTMQGYRCLVFNKQVLLQYKDNYNFKKYNNIETCIRNDIIQIKPFESWTIDKAYADTYEQISAEMKSKYNSNTDVVIRLSAMVTGIYIPEFWNKIKQQYYAKDGSFTDLFHDIDEDYEQEKEILCKGGNDYVIYNLKEIYQQIKGDI